MADAPRSASQPALASTPPRRPAQRSSSLGTALHAPPSPDRPRLVVDRAVARSTSFYAFQGASVSLLELRAHEVAALRQLKRPPKAYATGALTLCVAVLLLGPLTGGVAGGMANVMEVGILEEWPYVTQAQWDLTNAILLAGGFFGIPLGVGASAAFGKLPTQTLNALIMALGAVVGARATGIHTVMLARAIIGVSAGSAGIVLPVYFGEVRQRKRRVRARGRACALAHARRSRSLSLTRARAPARSSRRRRCAACSACSSPSRACWAW